MGQYDDKAWYVLKIIAMYIAAILLVVGLTLWGAIHFWGHPSMVGYVFAVCVVIEIGYVAYVLKC